MGQQIKQNTFLQKVLALSLEGWAKAAGLQLQIKLLQVGFSRKQILRRKFAFRMFRGEGSGSKT